MAENYIDLKFVADTAPLERAEKVADRLEKRINKLVSDEAKGRITTQQYSAEVRKLASEMQKASGGTIQARNAVYSYSKAVYQAAEEARQFAAAAQASQKAIHRKGVVMQQFGYQVGDFIVQIQSGTNAFVAFGQQATQLVGVMGMLNPALIGISAALGIIIPLVTAFGAAWMRSKDSMKEASESADDLEGKIKSLDNSIKSFRRTQEALASGLSEDFFTGIEGLDQAVLDVIQAEATVQDVRERIAKPGFGFRDMLPFLGLYLDTKDLDNAEKALSAAEQKRADAIKRLQQVRENDRIKSEQRIAKQTEEYILDMADVFRDAQQRMRGESGKTLQEIDAGYKAVAASQTTLNPETDSYIKKMSDLFTKSQELRKELGDAAFEVLRLSGIDLSSNINPAVLAAAKLAADLNISLVDAYKLQNADVSKGVMAAAAAAKELARDLNISLRSAMAMAGMISSRRTEDVFDPRDPRSQSQDFKSERLRRMMESGELYKDFPKDKKDKKGGSRKSPAEQLEEYMQQQEKQLEIQRTGVMLGEEQARVSELLNKYKEAGVEIDMKRIQQLAEEEQRLKMLTYAHSALENALMSVVDGTQSVGDAFKAMLRDMILEIYREKVAKSFASSVLSIFGFSKGGVFNNGNVTAFANGGVVGAPTYFPMGGGTGLMGEAGPEAIMPLKRGANGKLGVEMHGGGSVVVNQSINISTGVQQTVRNEIRSMMPQIAEQSKAAVLDAKRRGGSYGGKF